MNLFDTLDRLANAQLVRPTSDAEPAYIFKNVLTQDTAYESLLRAQRRAIHRHVAHAYQAVYGEPGLDDYAGILAHHYAEAGDDEQTRVYATRAGDVAARLYANAEAIASYTTALDAAKRSQATTAQLIDLYTKRGRVLEVMGNMDALATYEEMTEFARTRGDRVLELHSLLLRGTLHATPTRANNRTRALRLAEEAGALARELGDRKAQARALWIEQLTYLYNDEIPDAMRCGEQALALARELGERELQGYIMGDLARAYANFGQIDQAALLEAEARVIWRELDNKPMLADNLMGSAALALIYGDYDQTLALTNEGIELSEIIGSKSSLMSNLGTQLFPLLERGEFATVLQHIKDIFRVADEMGGFGVGIQPAFAALTYAYLGAYEQGKEMEERVWAGLNQSMPGFFSAWSRALLAQYYLLVGKLDAAAAVLAQSQIGEDYNRGGPATMFGLVALGECLLGQREYEHAFQLMAKRLTALRRAGIHQSVHDALFIQAKAMRAMGKLDQAVELLQQARSESEKMQSRRLLWQIYAALSEIESEQGHPAEAEHFLRLARDVIAFMAEHTPQEFRASFLNLPAVRKVMPE